MTTIDLRCGDAIKLLRTLPDCSVDAVVTDPDYELIVHPSIKLWGGVPKVEWAAECLRVLKPGGHLLAFGGSRTYHRLAVAVEDAGFEIRDSLIWLYGCLTADVEVLTEHGWRPGIDLREGDRVAQWHPETNAIDLAPVEHTYRAPWDGPMRVLRNTDTDQVLTPNHRVWHENRHRKMTEGVRRGWYDGQWTVAEAADLSTWNPVRLPVAGIHGGPGIGGDDYAALLGWVWTEGGFDHSGTGVRIYQSSVNGPKCDEIAALLDRLGPSKRYDYERNYTRSTGALHQYTSSTWFITGDLANRVRGDLPGKRPTYDLLWRMTVSEKRAMLRAAMLGDGTGWSSATGEQFFQKHEDDLVWLQTLLALIGWSGKVGMRPDRPGGAVYLRRRATTELQARHLRDSAEQYTGEVWCIGVPLGAFVARRNGKVFITGNSGFPKSHNISKAIDKARQDHPDWKRVGQWLQSRRKAAGLGTKALCAAIGAHGDTNHGGAVSNWENGLSCPTWDQWCAMQQHLRFGNEMDAEVWRLNGRKGTPGQAWQTAEVVGVDKGAMVGWSMDGSTRYVDRDIKVPNSDEAKQWDGWGSALKPGHEPIVCARKPFNGTLAANVLEHGTGGLNIDACRIEVRDRAAYEAKCASVIGLDSNRTGDTYGEWAGARADSASAIGRWPANVILDEGAAAELDAQTAGTRSSKPSGTGSAMASEMFGVGGLRHSTAGQGDAGGGASRFFTTVDTREGEDSADRRYGDSGGTDFAMLSGQPYDDSGGASRFFYTAKASKRERPVTADGFKHPTVKPLSVVSWIVRLVTPPGGIVLDPFAGSGTTIEACLLEGFDCIAFDIDPRAIELCRIRVERNQPDAIG